MICFWGLLGRCCQHLRNIRRLPDKRPRRRRHWRIVCPCPCPTTHLFLQILLPTLLRACAALWLWCVYSSTWQPFRSTCAANLHGYNGCNVITMGSAASISKGPLCAVDGVASCMYYMIPLNCKFGAALIEAFEAQDTGSLASEQDSRSSRTRHHIQSLETGSLENLFYDTPVGTGATLHVRQFAGRDARYPRTASLFS